MQNFYARIQQVKGMKARIRNLKLGMFAAYLAGKQSVAQAAHHLDYGPGYPVEDHRESYYSPVPDTLDVRCEDTCPTAERHADYCATQINATCTCCQCPLCTSHY